MQSDIQTTSNNIYQLCTNKNIKIHPLIQSFATISIDTNITRSSLYKKYKWITSLQLITSQQYHARIILNKHSNNEATVKYLHIDKLLYLVVRFCEDDHSPITRIRTMKYACDQDWIALQYPKQSEGLYQLSIYYQNKQVWQSKRIITDIQICSGRQLQGVGRGDQWELAKVPQFSINYLNPAISIQTRQKSKQRKTGTGSIDNISVNANVNSNSNEGEDIQLESKMSDLSNSNKLQTSDLSINSYYSCEEPVSQKESTQRQQLSDRPPISPGSLGRESYQDNKKSSLTQFHSMEEQESPLFFIMKTVDLYDSHNEFQYVYLPKKDSLVNIFTKKSSVDFVTLSNFCFPNGIKLSKKIQGWGYQIFNFILTSSEGQRIFAYCLKFQQKMDSSSQSKLMKELGDLGFINNSHDNIKHQIYAEKAFCLLSNRCQTDYFYKILQHLYKVYLSFSHLPQISFFPDSKSQKCKDFQFFSHKFVKYIQNLQQNVATKKIQKKMNLHKHHQIHNDSEHNIKFSWCDFSFQIPKYSHHPLSSKSLYCLLKCLSMDNIIKIIICLLTDKKIFFVSNLQNVLGYIIQAFINIIYPLKWEHVIIPIITQDFIDYLQAPMPIIVGMKDEIVNQQTISQTKGIYVFLDCNKLLMIDQIPQVPNHFQECQKKLKHYQVYNAMHVEQLLNFQQKAYSFDIHQIQEHNLGKTQQIKSIFFNYMVKILKNYNQSFCKQQQVNTSSVPIKRLSLNNNQEQQRNKNNNNNFKQDKRHLMAKQGHQKQHKTFKQLYNCQSFILNHSKSSQPFYQQLCKSSSFANLIQNKYYQPQNHIQIKILDEAIQQFTQDNFSKTFSCLSSGQIKAKQHNIRSKKCQHIQKDSKKAKFLNVTARKSKQNTTQRLDRGVHNNQFISSEHQEQRSFRTKNINVSQTKQLKMNMPAQIHQQRYSEGRNHTNTLREQQEFTNNKQNQMYFEEEPYNNKKQKTMGGNICIIVQSLSKKVSQSGSFVAVWTQAKVNRLKKYFKQEEKQKKMRSKKQDTYINKLKKEIIKQESQFKITIKESRTSNTQKKVRNYQE